MESCIASFKDEQTGKFKQPVSGSKYLSTHALKREGVYVILDEANFVDNPLFKDIPASGFPPIMSEFQWGLHPPLLLRINTSKQAHSGDYEIFETLTYSDGVDICAETASVGIHVRTTFEQHQWKIAIAGIVIAITSPAWGEMLSYLVRTFILPNLTFLVNVCV